VLRLSGSLAGDSVFFVLLVLTDFSEIFQLFVL
jgi:hypothetical protein